MGERYPDLSQRLDYQRRPLDGTDLGPDPIAALRRWLSDAEEHEVTDFNAVVVCTVDADAQPTARNVLLRGIDDSGRLRFFTNQSSRKGQDIAVSPKVSLLFSWLPIHRQVRVDGTAEPLGDAESDEYFRTRPRGSRLAAWASPQSEVIGSRAALDDAMAAEEARFADTEVTRPPHWGGYAVTPTAFEFWQGRPNRLHDRLRFTPEGPTLEGAGAGAGGRPWVIDRLGP